jgi:preprotein translocase subunit SecD
MNRYPLWKNLIIGLVLVIGLLYSLPNFFGEAPAVQISSVNPSEKIDSALMTKVETVLKASGTPYEAMYEDPASLKVSFRSTDLQLKAKDLIQNGIGQGYVVALNLIPRSPAWLRSLGALPMYLGLDLRGGVHFLMQVDMKAAITMAMDRNLGEIRADLRDADVRYSGISRQGDELDLHFDDKDAMSKAKDEISRKFPDLLLISSGLGITAQFKPAAVTKIQEFAIQQNITTLRNRVNELGVAEPIIQQQGADRVVVELPGVQDTAKAKDILGRTATLEIHMVDDEHDIKAAIAGQIPFGDELLKERGGAPILVKKNVVLTGEHINDAQPGFDNSTGEPAVHINLDSTGTRIFKQVTADNVGKRMAILLIEKGIAEVVTAPVIREEIGGGRVQISGHMTTGEAHDVALLLRAGALAAPMEIIEERTVGPSLGADNIRKGFDSTMFGFIAISIFMTLYYMLFGFVSVVALGSNLLLLVAVLSLLQATLTLPGMAGIALTLGMAIDANVLINERIRDEIRNGNTPQAAINAGYERAFGTILDSNITTLIAGIALFIFGSGPVKGFAVVLCLGILTSMFSAVLVSRAIVNFAYGRRRVSKLMIG